MISPILEVWMSLIGLTMGFSGIPQMLTIHKNKSGDNFSVKTWLLIVHGLAWWLYYGTQIGSTAMVLTNSLGVTLNSAMICMVLYYRYKQGEKDA